MLIEFINSFSAASRLLNSFTAENAAIIKMADGSKELQDVCADMAHSCVTKIIFI